MLCQNCGKNEANTHIKQILNGEMNESHLCSECANHLGYSDMFSGFNFGMSDFFSGILGDMVPSLTMGSVKRCEKCGCSFDEIVRSGRVGCSECYSVFYDKLLPSIQRIHGKIKHSGKISSGNVNVKKEETREEKIEKLRLKMNDAVSEQRFEDAASIRDEIKALEGGTDNE